MENDDDCDNPNGPVVYGSRLSVDRCRWQPSCYREIHTISIVGFREYREGDSFEWLRFYPQPWGNLAFVLIAICDTTNVSYRTDLTWKHSQISHSKFITLHYHLTTEQYALMTRLTSDFVYMPFIPLAFCILATLINCASYLHISRNYGIVE